MSSCNWGAVGKHGLMDGPRGGRKDSISKGGHSEATEGTILLSAVRCLAGLGGAPGIAKEGMRRQGDEVQGDREVNANTQ